MTRSLPEDVRLLVAERADFRCEYCLTPESDSFISHQLDHIIALKHGGSSRLDNLAFCCALCNMRKGSDVASLDSVTGQIVRLFNPRQDVWAEHFRLAGPNIEPLTSIGRVTITLLQLNRTSLLAERGLLLELGRLQPPAPRR